MAAPHRTNTAKAAQKNTNALGLAELLANRKAPTVLLADIRAHVMERAAVPDPDRRTDRLHPSDICRSNWCPRANFHRLGGSVAPEHVTFAREAVFEYGHDAHNRWQRWMTQMRLLEGNWYCACCRSVFHAHGPAFCSDCGSPEIRYDEQPLYAPDLLLEGRTDGYIPTRNCLVEIKTVGEGTIRHADPALLQRHRIETPRGVTVDLKGLWDDIHRPFTTHLRQGQLYLHMAHQMGLTAERMVYIYESKLTQDAKEFTVGYDKSLIAGILDAAHAVRQAYDGIIGAPPCRFPDGCDDCDALQ